MSELLSWKIQKAISAKLKDDGIASGRVYDMPPPSSTFPYVVLGEDEMKSWDTHTTTGFEVRILLHVFSSQEGRAEVKQLSANICEAMNRNNLIIQGHKLLHVSVESIQTSRDIKHKTAQSLIKIAILGIETGEE